MAKEITNTNNQNPSVDKPERAVPFLKIAPITLVISLAMIVIGIVFYVKHGGFTLGIDFKGGARVETQVATPDVSINNIRVLFDNVPGDKQVTTLGAVSDQHFLVTLSADDTNQVIQGVETIIATLNNAYGESNVTILGSELVGPKIGSEFAKRSILLLLVVAGLILLYVAIRFDFYYGTGAVVALFHDMLIMSAFCIFYNIPIDMTIIAAFLTILGYSINDTIVVFDRVRENFGTNPDEDYTYMMNRSITTTLSRTVVTGLTTLFVSMAIWFWGGRVLHDFGFLLSIGIISGTYSSIFIASPITWILKRSFDKKRTHFADLGNVPVKKAAAKN